MNKADLIQQLENHVAWDNLEETHRLQMLYFLKTGGDRCYDNDNRDGHVTASCFLINREGDQTLFMEHSVLKQWFKPGGHCDGLEDVLAAAQREGEEETGLKGLTLIHPHLLDVDVHAIPKHPTKDMPAHLHYDITYLFQTDDMNFIQNYESLALAWLTPEQALEKQNKPHYQRMIAKWQDIVVKRKQAA